MSSSLLEPTGRSGAVDGKEYFGEVKNGALLLDGVEYSSPSAADCSVTQSPVNGWTFWQCLRPGDAQWIPINTLRV